MKSSRSRAALSVLLAAAADVVFRDVALGHTSGAGASPEHILLELAEWGLGIAAVLGLIVLVFWIRARRRRDVP